ncbi:hypothetical protein DLH72_01055 [Candidatus Gracilibacteria bacterium]|nr:MAG: hypothetical protein DLH72_01055 [Candidatus Gracilibacteria bacterium]
MGKSGKEDSIVTSGSQIPIVCYGKFNLIPKNFRSNEWIYMTLIIILFVLVLVNIFTVFIKFRK